MADMGKWLIVLGLIIAASGVILYFSGKIPGIGKLPGDIFLNAKTSPFISPLPPASSFPQSFLSCSGSSENNHFMQLLCRRLPSLQNH
jgi:Protein of unknown function (DUF2905)